ncbi:MAG: cytochrome c3 family protein [Bacteroidetes bacterium]|nr:cytochrome c3 family protein [Bacteroidota bacterium]
MRTALLIFTGMVAGSLIGWFAFPAALYRTEEQPMQFNHKVHTGDQGGMACTDCHATNEQGRFLGIPAVAKCAECHAAPLGTTPQEQQLVDHYVTPGKEIPWKVYSRQPDNAFFSHASHVTIGEMKCEDCHGPHGQSESIKSYQENRISGYSRDVWGANISGFQSEPWQGMKMSKCVQCHTERQRVDGCIACHK